MTKTQKICLYKTSYGAELVTNYYENEHYDWIQISEPMAVAFILLPQETQIINEINIIDRQLTEIQEEVNLINKQLTEIQEEALRKMEQLKEKKAQLLALAAPKEEN